MRGQQVVFSKKDTAELVGVDVNDAPLAPDELRGRTRATVISAGTELASYRGERFPVRPGYAAVWEVEEVGAEVKDIAPGQLVFSMGGHASHQRSARKGVLPVPEGLAPEKAVFARMMNVTMSTLTTTTARPGDRVMVTGLGLVGHLGAQAFARCGYRVTGVDPAAPRREAARAKGIVDVRDTAPVDDAAYRGQVALVLECSGHEAATLAGCRIVRPRGEVVMVGVPWRRRTEIYAHEVLDAVFHQYAVLRSGWEWEVPRHPEPFKVGSIYGQIATALDWLSSGRVKVDDIFEQVAPSQAQTAYQAQLNPDGGRLATVFDWTAL